MTNLVTANSTIRHDAEPSLAGPSTAAGDYLRALFALGEGGRAATTTQVAERVGVRPASATAMLQKLATAEPPLVEYHKNHGARLTAAGERAALALIRCHRLLELFLHEKLGYAWDEVHDEADRLEHVISAEMADRLAEALGRPTRDPHGHAIPAADLSLPAEAALPLTELAPGHCAAVLHVSDEDAAALRRLAVLGVRPGVVATRDDAVADGVITLHLRDGATAMLSPADAARVFVSPLMTQPTHYTQCGDHTTP